MKESQAKVATKNKSNPNTRRVPAQPNHRGSDTIQGKSSLTPLAQGSRAPASVIQPFWAEAFGAAAAVAATGVAIAASPGLLIGGLGVLGATALGTGVGYAVDRCAGDRQAPVVRTSRMIILDAARVLAGVGAVTPNHVFTAMTAHMQQHNWRWVPNYNNAAALLDVPPGVNGSNCRGYADALLSLMADAGIGGAVRDGVNSPYITNNVPRMTIDPLWTGNVIGTNRFAFTSHYWVVAGGTIYDPAMNTQGADPRQAIEYTQTWRDADSSHREFTNAARNATVYLTETNQNHQRGWTLYQLATVRPQNWPAH